MIALQESTHHVHAILPSPIIPSRILLVLYELLLAVFHILALMVT